MKFERSPQDGMVHPEETQEVRLRHFLCNHKGQFNANMHAWLQHIGGDDAHVMRIEAETGQLPPMFQLARYCADQALKAEVANQPGFARKLLEHAHQAHDSLQSRYLREWIAHLMDLARSKVGQDAADSVLVELIKS